MSGRPTRVVLVDDHVLVRSGMRALLDAEPDLQVTGEAGDGAEGVEVALAKRPDVVVMDLELPVLDGIAATRRLRAAGSGAQILVVTGYDDDRRALGALEAGATGFLVKDMAAAQLTEAVRMVAQGGTLLAPRRLLAHLGVRRSALRSRFDALTDREREIVRQLARGLNNAQLAAHFDLSELTVKSHVTRLLSKLRVAGRVQAVVLAYESGFVRPGDTDGIEL